VAHKLRAATSSLLNLPFNDRAQPSANTAKRKREPYVEGLLDDDDFTLMRNGDKRGPSAVVRLVRECEGWTGVERVRWNIFSKLSELFKSYTVYLIS
jgi:hypothetical protein